MIPIDQNLDLMFDLQRELILGSTTILIDIASPVDMIRVSAADMLWDMFTVVLLDSAGMSIPVQKYQIDSDMQVVNIALSRVVPKGQYTLRMEFGSAMRKDLMGCYISHSKDDQGNLHPFVVSQFEPNFARTCFPTFDEPNVKMPFTIHLTAPVDMDVLSNTKAVGVEITWIDV